MNTVDRVTRHLAHLVRWLSVLMVVTTVAIVVARYVFEASSITLQESVMYMHGLMFMIGIPYGIAQNTHVRVDLLYNRLSPQRKAMVNCAGHVLFLVPLCVFILVTSWTYVGASWRVLEGSSEVGGIPGIFLLKTLIPVTAGLMLLQALSEIAKTVTALRGRT